MELMPLNFHELLTPLMAGTALLLLAGGMLHGYRGNGIRARQREIREGLTACRQLQKMVALLQQHRGLSSAWLAGGAFSSRMQEKRGEIERQWSVLSDLAHIESRRIRPCYGADDLINLLGLWNETVAHLEASSTDQNIARHSRMIAKLLEWTQAVGESRIELPGHGLLPGGLARSFSCRLPALTECLGQARALGSAAASRKLCDPVAKVRLMFLIARAESLLNQAGESDTPAGRIARREIEAVFSAVRGQLLGNEGVSIAPDTFFTIATQAIDAVFAWIEACEQSVETLLERAEGQGKAGSNPSAPSYA